ncbi:hypothetical protein Scep_028174 [Stephania cephalantha]|uniref:Uncharacterized protein n=1 Tax=Stephania cephalantha TaxID=152367 RepID=A0AAP0ECM1_9MAGN
MLFLISFLVLNDYFCRSLRFINISIYLLMITCRDVLFNLVWLDEHFSCLSDESYIDIDIIVLILEDVCCNSKRF